MLIDEVEVTLRAGHGGVGKASFNPGKKGGPNGGNGGRGGNIYIKVSSDLSLLNQFSQKKILIAEDGKAGGSFRKSGPNGQDLWINLPVGTSLLDEGDLHEIGLSKVGEEILLCRGGLGGKGNFDLKSARNTTPLHAQSGLPGEEKFLKLSLKLIADFGLIGLPNAGKSSLLNALTSAGVKTAHYPFTTLEANLGVLDHKIIADIPGLIEGASQGKGLGIKFLKHIEKVGTLLHCISSQSEDVVRDYQIVREEMEKYNSLLLGKTEIILLTKVDLSSLDEIKQKIAKLEVLGKKVSPVSILEENTISSLKTLLLSS